MERDLKSYVLQKLPNLSEETLNKVLQCLEEDCGVESIDDLPFVEEKDLTGCLKPVQIRKLLRPLQTESRTPARSEVGVNSYAESSEFNSSLTSPTTATSKDETDEPKTSVGALDSEKLFRASLGRLAKIGDLYDARSDSFIGQSIFGQTDVSTTTVTQSANVEILLEDSLPETFAKLHVEDELQLSYIVGLAQAHGCLDTFIKDGFAKNGSIKGCLIYTLNVFDEQLAMCSSGLSFAWPENLTDNSVDLKFTPSFDNPNATHVVVGISWGVRVIILIEHRDVRNLDRKTIESDLERRLRMLASACLTLNRASYADFTDENYIITILSDPGVPDQSDEQPQTFDSVLSFIQHLPRQIKDSSSQYRTALTYTMVPLSSLDKQCQPNDRWKKIVDATLQNRVLNLFDNLLLRKQQVDALVRDMKQHEYCLLPSDLTKACQYSRQLDDAVKLLRERLARGIVECRSRKGDISNVIQTAEEFDKSAFSSDSVKQLLMQYQDIDEKMAFIDAARKEDVLYISHEDLIDKVASSSLEVYILFSSRTLRSENRELWNVNCCTFFETITKIRNKQMKHLASTKRENNAIRSVTFAFVDCDLMPRSAYADKISIRHYVNGTCVCQDLAEENASIAAMNLVKSSVQMESCQLKAPKRAILELPCPGSVNRCPKTGQIWHCKKCLNELEYGFDEFVYCSCGRAPFHALRFRCGDYNHEKDFMEFQPEALKNLLQKLVPLKEITILFLGETGVGKSTWINGFANYLLFSTLTEAQGSDDVGPIPSTFTMTNEYLEEVQITTGSDPNEESEVGSSATQMPKTYLFKYKRMLIRIIDTPGIGDTKGIDYDKRNMQNIMTHLGNYEEVNGICVLLKPNNARLTVMFSFCIKELLTHLHRDACKNIVFCFTNARSTFYRPGDTLPALKKLLANNPDIEIKLEERTVYCIDNEAVRFLAALKHGVVFGDSEKLNYQISWETSVKETQRLVEYISSLKPHKLKNTLSLNDTRRLLVALSRPMAEISSTIQNNIGAIEHRRNEIQQSSKRKEDLVKSLYIPAIDLRTRPLKRPRTVCTSPGCVEYISVGDIQKVDYKQHCHPNCRIKGALTDTLNCMALKKCSAMGPGPLYMCKRCGCSWAKHMHITYDCEQVLTKVIDAGVEKQILEKATDIELIEHHITALKIRMKELDDEKKRITEVSAKFGCFLTTNALWPYNDALDDYLEYLITLEKEKPAGTANTENLRQLEDMRLRYNEEVRVLKEAINDPDRRTRMPTPEDVMALIKELYDLRFSGPMLESAVRVAETGATAAVQYSEENVQPRRRQRRRWTPRTVWNKMTKWIPRPPWRY